MLVSPILTRHIHIETDVGTCKHACVGTCIGTCIGTHRRIKTHVQVQAQTERQTQDKKNTDSNRDKNTSVNKDKPTHRTATYGCNNAYFTTIPPQAHAQTHLHPLHLHRLTGTHADTDA